MTAPARHAGRSAAVSVLFATAAVPVIGSLGLAIDCTIVAQARQQMAVAADAAVLTAVKDAAAAYQANPRDPDIFAASAADGQQWFVAQLGDLPGRVRPDNPVVTLRQDGTSFTATITYRATVQAQFAGMLGLRGFPVSGVGAASLQLHAFTDSIIAIGAAAARPALRDALAAALAQLRQNEALPHQYGVALYSIGPAPSMLYPPDPSGGDVGTNLDAATRALPIAAPAPPQADADLGDAVTYLARHLTVSGDGTTPSSPRKNLFIVTAGARDATATAAGCAALKAMGISLFVVYRPPANTPAATATLRDCASDPSQDFVQADDDSQITVALQRLLTGSIHRAARVRA